MTSRVFNCINFLPNYGSYKISISKNLIHYHSQKMHFMIIDADEDRSIFPQKFPQQRQPWVHHAQPLVMSGQVFGLAADDLPQPSPHLRTVDGVVVDPVFIARVVGGIDVNALDLPGIVGQERLEGEEIVTFDQQIAVVRVAGREIRFFPEQVKGNLAMMIEDGFFPDLVKRRHKINRSEIVRER